MTRLKLIYLESGLQQWHFHSGTELTTAISISVLRDSFERLKLFILEKIILYPFNNVYIWMYKTHVILKWWQMALHFKSFSSLIEE